jgi:hypothetical protein
MSATQFCIRACKEEAQGPALCNHIYDVMGCDWNMPGNYAAGTFEDCLGDSGPVSAHTQPARQPFIYFYIIQYSLWVSMVVPLSTKATPQLLQRNPLPPLRPANRSALLEESLLLVVPAFHRRVRISLFCFLLVSLTSTPQPHLRPPQRAPRNQLYVIPLVTHQPSNSSYFPLTTLRLPVIPAVVPPLSGPAWILLVSAPLPFSWVGSSSRWSDSLHSKDLQLDHGHFLFGHRLLTILILSGLWTRGPICPVVDTLLMPGLWIFSSSLTTLLTYFTMSHVENYTCDRAVALIRLICSRHSARPNSTNIRRVLYLKRQSKVGVQRIIMA